MGILSFAFPGHIFILYSSGALPQPEKGVQDSSLKSGMDFFLIFFQLFES